MPGKTRLEIVSPAKLLLSREVDMAVIPAAEGDMGVLPGHAPMIVTLRGGVIAIHDEGQVTDRLFVGGGFAEVTPERCTVLADEAVPVTELSRAEAASRVTTAQAEYDATTKQAGASPAAVEAAMARLQAAQTMAQVAEAA